MNKLTTNLFTKRQWGNEVIWALTDNYMAKTIEMPKETRSPLFLNNEKDRSLIVVKGHLSLVCGVDTYILSEGWSWHIPQGSAYRYESFEEPIRIIEVSTPHLESTTIIKDAEESIMYIPPKDETPLKVNDINTPKKRGRKKIDRAK